MPGLRNRLGTHIAENMGVLEGIAAVRSMELDAFQMYLAARQNSWWPIKVSDQLGTAVKELKGDAYGIAHAPFVVNILTDPAGYRYANHSWKSLVYHLERAETLGFQAVVFHMGSPGGLGAEKGYDHALWYLANVYKNYSGPVKLCIENDANPKKNPAGDFDAIIKIIEKTDKPNLRACLDVTHTFAYGHDIRIPEILDGVLNKIGPFVEVVHFNQPLATVALGSAKDRHADPIDQGAFGIAPMYQIWNYFENKPFIIEGTEDFNYDREIVKNFNTP